MASTTEAVWLNFSADDLPQEQNELFKALLNAKHAFEASFPCSPGKALRFSYKGADWDKMGMCEVDKPKDKAAVATSLSAWIASQKAANAKH